MWKQISHCSRLYIYIYKKGGGGMGLNTIKSGEDCARIRVSDVGEWVKWRVKTKVINSKLMGGRKMRPYCM